MKKLLLLLFIFLTFQPANAAVKPLIQSARVEGEGLFIDKNTIYTYSNIESVTSDAVINTYDSKGALLSKKVIDGGGSDYIAAVSSDGAGNFWLAGGDSPATSTSTLDTRTASAINPDGAIAEVIPALREDIKNIVIWKFTSATGSITRYSYNYGAPILVTAISADSRGISVVGLTVAKGLPHYVLLSAKPSGEFGQPISIGNKGTTLNGIQRQSDGSIVLIGSISEPLNATQRIGKKDAVLIKIVNGGISRISGSGARNSEREWTTIGSSTLLAGYIKTGKVSQVAIMKYANEKPVWSYLYPSSGSAVTYLNSSGAYLAYSASTGVILNTYSTKGQAGNTYQSSKAQNPLAMAYSRELGPVLLAASDDGVFLFTPTSG